MRFENSKYQCLLCNLRPLVSTARGWTFVVVGVIPVPPLQSQNPRESAATMKRATLDRVCGIHTNWWIAHVGIRFRMLTGIVSESSQIVNSEGRFDVIIFVRLLQRTTAQYRSIKGELSMELVLDSQRPELTLWPDSEVKMIIFTFYNYLHFIFTFIFSLHFIFSWKWRSSV